jgi:hypothetical protein
MKRLNTMFVFMVLIGLVVFLIASLSSCQSKSGHRATLRNQQTTVWQEKCVVLSDTLFTTGEASDKMNITRYRVNRITKGVVDKIWVPGLPVFEKGDTIFHDFHN